MRTSLNKIKEADDYLLKVMDPEEAVLYEAKLILNPEMKSELYWHRKTHEAVRTYARAQLRREINAVHDKLFFQPEHSTFRKKVMSFFSF